MPHLINQKNINLTVVAPSRHIPRFEHTTAQISFVFGTYDELFVTSECTPNGTPKGTPCWETKPNLLSSHQLLPHGTAAILDHLELGCGGNKCALLVDHLMNFICFSRLNSRDSGYQQEGSLSWQQKATLGIVLEINGGNVCTLPKCCFIDTDFVIIGFEVE